MTIPSTLWIREKRYFRWRRRWRRCGKIVVAAMMSTSLKPITPKCCRKGREASTANGPPTIPPHFCRDEPRRWTRSTDCPVSSRINGSVASLVRAKRFPLKPTPRGASIPNDSFTKNAWSPLMTTTTIPMRTSTANTLTWTRNWWAIPTGLPKCPPMIFEANKETCALVKHTPFAIPFLCPKKQRMSSHPTKVHFRNCVRKWEFNTKIPGSVSNWTIVPYPRMWV
mmetsp:Transcript_4068/g.7285  ORF Transcript_4068/g.7285 Transcript_4068/m.7285 type:complete len:225 (+) Transcript_4068:402-1076(+)